MCKAGERRCMQGAVLCVHPGRRRCRRRLPTRTCSHPLQIVDLAPCKKLARLDVSKNELKSLDGLGACTALRWLSAASNAVTTEGAADALKDLEHLEVWREGSTLQPALFHCPPVTWWGCCALCHAPTPAARASQVLNLGRNQLAGKIAVGRLRALKALILNENQLTLVGGEPAAHGQQGRAGELQCSTRACPQPAQTLQQPA